MHEPTQHLAASVQRTLMVTAFPGSVDAATSNDPESFVLLHAPLRVFGVFAANVDAAARYAEQGATLLAVGSDALFLGRGAREALEMLRAARDLSSQS